jgi:DNA-binding transcriptional LysR family regulator
MRTNLAQFETFYWVARLGGFHAAARRQGLTQPTVSARVRELEGALGVRLFDRTRRRAEITPEGQEVLERAEQILRIAGDIEQTVRQQGPLRGLLRLGAVETVALTALTELLPRLRTAFPELRVELSVDMGSALCRLLNARELDLAVVTDPRLADGFSAEPVGRILLRWVASPKLGLPRRPLVPADLTPYQIFTGPEPSTLRAVMFDWFREAELEPRHVNTSNSHMLMAKLVAAQLGVAVLPPAILESEISAGALRVLTTRPAVSAPHLYVCTPQDRRHAELRPVIGMIRAALRQSGLFGG